MTGLGVSTVCAITEEVCEAMVKHLWRRVLTSSCHIQSKNSRTKSLTWKKCGRFPAVWQRLTAATFQ
jgi:hypothetical protein